MYNIGEFFKRIQSVRMKNVLIQNTVAEVVREIVSYNIKPDDIVVSGTVVTLKGINSAVRSELFIKKAKLLEEINSRQTLKNITDLR